MTTRYEVRDKGTEELLASFDNYEALVGAADHFPLHTFESVWIDAISPRKTSRTDGTFLGVWLMAPILGRWRRTT